MKFPNLSFLQNQIYDIPNQTKMNEFFKFENRVFFFSNENNFTTKQKKYLKKAIPKRNKIVRSKVKVKVKYQNLIIENV